ncbi:MAG: uroporphyrinogen-III synthase [Pseudomonadota bacterium]
MTRPEPDHADLVDAVRQRGYPVIHCPAFRLRASDCALSVTERTALCVKTDVLIAVSPMAARSTLKWFTPELLANCCIIAPGATTASVFLEQGLDVTVPPAPGSSEAILSLTELQQVAGQTIVLVAAADGRSLLTETLRARGASVRSLELYRREPLPPATRFLQCLDHSAGGGDSISLVSSGLAFHHLCEALNETQLRSWLNSTFIVSSDRLKAIVSHIGAGRIELARSAADVDMLRALDGIVGT